MDGERERKDEQMEKVQQRKRGKKGRKVSIEKKKLMN